MSSDLCSTASFPGELNRTIALGWGKDGTVLHREVAMERWCITWEDLRFFRQQIEEAIAAGAITPTELDDFASRSSKDQERIGPNMYTVVEQYLKPVTLKAGGMSWALMCHPEGLHCHLFITHAWCEGVYEFVDKVMVSWPAGKHAYCCIFSNPQNLNITDLIASPKESPFAKCLFEASHMLVVPNQKQSIYTRLWCVYEASLAYKSDKIIIFAHAPIRRRFAKWLGIQSVMFVLGIAIGLLVTSDDACDDSDFGGGWPTPVMCIVGMVSQAKINLKAPESLQKHLPPLCLTFFANCVGTCFCSVWVAIYARTYFWNDCLHNWMEHAHITFNLYFVCLFGGVFVCTEVDRLDWVEEKAEAMNLTKDFTDVKDASCYNESDKAAIWEEIGTDTSDIDDAVRVLLLAGMSTPHLRKAYARKANIQSAGAAYIASALFGIGSWLAFFILLCMAEYELKENVAKTIGRRPDTIIFDNNVWIISNICILVFYICLLVFFRYTHPERWAFAISSSSKLMLLMMLVAYVSSTSMTMEKRMSRRGNESIENELVQAIYEYIGFYLFVWSSVVFVCACAGVAGVARIPIIGRYATFLLGPRVKCTSYQSYGN